MSTYAAFIRQEEGICYGVDFPDFPGCISAGDTIEEAEPTPMKHCTVILKACRTTTTLFPHPCRPIALTHYLIGNPMNSP